MLFLLFDLTKLFATLIFNHLIIFQLVKKNIIVTYMHSNVKTCIPSKGIRHFLRKTPICAKLKVACQTGPALGWRC